MVHPGGRPRTTSLQPEEMIKLGEEMVEWVQLNKPIHLSQWYTIHKGFVYNQWKKFIEKEEFRPYYEQSLKLVGLNYINGNINPSIAHRFINVYFKDSKEQEKQDFQDKLDAEFEQKKRLMEFEALLKSKQTENVSEDVKNAFDALMNQFLGKSDLNKEDKSNKSV